uniref:SH2 domain-containing protein n=1 Tax=Syphacia muris TaxID=451379 RepID=A0A0N5AFM5_9BILA
MSIESTEYSTATASKIDVDVRYLGYCSILKKVDTIESIKDVSLACMKLLAYKVRLRRYLSVPDFAALQSMIGDRKVVDQEVTLSIYSKELILHNDTLTAKHQIRNIKFASFLKDTDKSPDIFCFTKNATEGRAEIRCCLVFSVERTKFIRDCIYQMFDGSGSNKVISKKYFIEDEAVLSPSEYTGVALGLEKQDWFHVRKDSTEAEKVLFRDGDFLVRKSHNTPDNYALSTISGTQPMHILLLDDVLHKVTTGGRTFETIVEFVEYFYTNAEPIVVDDFTIKLLHPVSRNATALMNTKSYYRI